MALMDTFMIYQFIKKLVTPFTEMPAYKAGLIDNQGKFLKQRAQFTSLDQQNCTYFDTLIINLKRLIAMVPGGKSKLASYAAALFLTRTYESFEKNPSDTLFKLEEKFNETLREVERLYEDAPMNSTAVIPDKTVVNPRVASKYKMKNMQLAARNSLKKPHKSQQFQYRKGTFAVGGVNEETTLEYHDKLNPKIWNDNRTLKDDIHAKLLEIADAWRDFAGIDIDQVKDLIITGGNCNYNYTDKSDIDLHLVVERNHILDHEVDCYCAQCQVNRSFIDDYLRDKKILWTLTHPDISIKGYPVELYAQDVTEVPHYGQGVYSLNKNEWIQSPQYLSLDFENNFHLQKKVKFYRDMIDKLIDNHADDDALKIVKDKITSQRGDSIAKGGEFAFGNLVFKELRNAGYLDKVDDYLKSKRDRQLSLESA